MKLAGAIASAIGFTGAIAVVGAAILWVRFDEVNLPADQAVDAVPNTELVVIGAQAVVTFTLVGLAAIAFIYFYDPNARVLQSTIASLVALAVVGVAYSVFSLELAFKHDLTLAFLAALLVMGCVQVGRRFPDFLPLAAAVFVSVLIFAGTVGYLIAQSQRDYVQGVAVLRGADDQGLTGVYVAASEKTLHFGRVLDEATSGLYELPRTGDLRYAVGPLEPRDEAAKRAQALLHRLRADARKLPVPAAPAPNVPEGATP